MAVPMTSAIAPLIRGVDVAGDVTALLPCLVADGVEFVARYDAIETRIPGKIITPAEAQAITAAGLHRVALWENGPADTVQYFNSITGARDGRAAIAGARRTGQPPGTPIYFVVDRDVWFGDLEAAVHPYFAAVAEAFAADPAYTVGVYGSGMVCANLIAWRVATVGWLAQAAHWSGFKPFAASPDCVIQQLGGTTVCGLPPGVSDRDAAREGYGGFLSVLPGVA